MLRTNKGFTLIELMVVIVIIGILAALAIPKFTNASAKAKMSEVPTALAAYENAQMARVAETGSLGDITTLVFDAPTGSKWFTYGENGGTDGTYRATASTDVGDFDLNDWAQTTFSATNPDADPTHTSNNVEACTQYIPNFGASS